MYNFDGRFSWKAATWKTENIPNMTEILRGNLRKKVVTCRAMATTQANKSVDQKGNPKTAQATSGSLYNKQGTN
jgi:hypothetical protein